MGKSRGYRPCKRTYNLTEETLWMLGAIQKKRQRQKEILANKADRSSNIVRDAIAMLYMYEVERASFEHPAARKAIKDEGGASEK